MTIAEIARDAAGFMETVSRENRGSFVRVREGAPEWVDDLVRSAHGTDMLPDDWRFETISAALDHIDSCDYDSVDEARDGSAEFADANVDTYSADRYRWLASHLARADYCDRAREDGLVAEDADIVDRIGVGQYAESEEIYAQLCDALEARADEIEEDAA